MPVLCARDPSWVSAHSAQALYQLNHIPRFFLNWNRSTVCCTYLGSTSEFFLSDRTEWRKNSAEDRHWLFPLLYSHWSRTYVQRSMRVLSSETRISPPWICLHLKPLVWISTPSTVASLPPTGGHHLDVEGHLVLPVFQPIWAKVHSVSSLVSLFYSSQIWRVHLFFFLIVMFHIH